MTPRRIVLVGFMASGKTTVGRGLAQSLGWRHFDIDEEIERETGSSIEEIFRSEGEPAFRALEVEVTKQILAGEAVVVSTGGGWVTNAGVVAALPVSTLIVWLRVSQDEVIRRLEAANDQPVRPLLAGSHPRQRIRELLAAREPLYRQAKVVVDTDGRSAAEVVQVLEQVVRSESGSSPAQD